jgi:hypothetical protein
VALLGTGVLETIFNRYMHFEELGLAPILRADAINAGLAFVLGVLVCRRFRSSTGFWVWIPWVISFLIRAAQAGAHLHRVFWEFAGGITVGDDQSLTVWTAVTIPAIRFLGHRGSLYADVADQRWNRTNEQFIQSGAA